MATPDSIRSYCPICLRYIDGEGTSNAAKSDVLARHIEKYHRIFRCTKLPCDFYTSDSMELSNHLRVAHSKNGDLVCPLPVPNIEWGNGNLKRGTCFGCREYGPDHDITVDEKGDFICLGNKKRGSK